MKKSKLLVLGLIALMLAGGLALASCGSKCDRNGDCEYDATMPYSSSYNLRDFCKDDGCGAFKAYKNHSESSAKCDC